MDGGGEWRSGGMLWIIFFFFDLAGGSGGRGFFLQAPHSSPPTVRPPPYALSLEKCPGVNYMENWVDNLCGDLNKGVIPENPFGHPFIDSYPFELMKNKTLEFFRKALPILKKDKALPKVARYNVEEPTPSYSSSHKRGKRSSSNKDFLELLESNGFDTKSDRRGFTSSFCDGQMSVKTAGYYNRLCKLYNAMWGKTPHQYRRESIERVHVKDQGSSPSATKSTSSLFFNNKARFTFPSSSTTPESKGGRGGKSDSSSGPPTPCPSSAEYLTPVFARNHEGAWRYVVQIPREGYFTQTVEVTKCLEGKCHYLEGSCRTSPRWQSLLVAEMYYPHTAFPTTPKPSEPPPVGDFNRYQQYLYKRAAVVSEPTGNNDIEPSCDGVDEIGCFQVRLFYDWFLIPGSCKCWKRPFDFAKAKF